MSWIPYTKTVSSSVNSVLPYLKAIVTWYLPSMSKNNGENRLTTFFPFCEYTWDLVVSDFIVFSEIRMKLKTLFLFRVIGDYLIRFCVFSFFISISITCFRCLTLDEMWILSRSWSLFAHLGLCDVFLHVYSTAFRFTVLFLYFYWRIIEVVDTISKHQIQMWITSFDK